MKTYKKTLLHLLIPLFLFAIAPNRAKAIDVSVSPAFSTIERTINATNGFDYLPNGDIISVVADQSSGVDTKLSVYLSEANGDYSPAGATPLATISLPAFTYPGFLTISPTGSFLVFGTTGGEDALFVMILGSNNIQKVANLGGNYDLVFTGDYVGYVSYNEGGFLDTDNKIAQFVLTPSGAVITPFAVIAGTYSGPIAVDSYGYLHYVKSGFSASDKRLLSFSAGQVANALVSSTPLTEADALGSIPVKASGDIVFSPNTTPGGELVLADYSTGELQHLSQATGYKPETLAFIGDVSGPVSPGILGKFKGSGKFKANASPLPKIGVSLAKNGYTSFTVLEMELKPTTIKPSTLSSNKNTIQIALSPVEDTDVVYSLTLYRQYVSGGKVKVKKIKTPDQGSNVFTVKKLQRGTYYYTYRTKKVVDGQLQSSLPSAVIYFTL